MKLYHVLVHVWYIINGTEFNEVNIVYKLPHKLLNNLRLTIIRKTFKKNLEIGWRHSLVSSHPSRNNTLAIGVRNYTKADAKTFLSVKFCLISLVSSKYFVYNCLRKQICACSSSQYLETRFWIYNASWKSKIPNLTNPCFILFS